MSAICTHRPPCPGCPRFGEDDLPPDEFAALEALARETGADLAPPLQGSSIAWRRRARLAVRGRAGAPKVGLFQEGSHKIVDVPRCLVHHPLINEAAQAIRTAIRRTGVEPHAEGPHRGVLRYVQLAVDDAGERVQVTLVARSADPASVLPLVAPLEAELGERLHSLWWNGHPERGNAILGPHWQLLTGEPWLIGTSGAARVFVHPGAFSQANPLLAETMFAAARADVPAGARVLELYAGSGALGLGLVARGETVVFDEIAPLAVLGLRRGLEELGARAGASEAIEAPAAQLAPRVRESDVVIADPPRKGLDEEILQALRDHPPERLILVACGFAAFLRDARRLQADGALALRRVRPVALFPWTAHLEVAALFTRR